MANEATLVLKGDSTQVVGEVKKIGDELDRGAGKARQLGTEFEKSIGKLARGVVIAKAIGDSIKAANAELEKINTERQTIAHAGISGRGGISRDAQRLGLGTQALGSILTASGSTTEQQRSGFLASLSEEDDKGANRKALQLFNTGLYTEKELRQGIKDGTLDQLSGEQAARRSAAGPDFQRLVDKEDEERKSNNAKFDAVRDTDLKVSEKKRTRELRRLENPQAAALAEGIQTGLGKVPVIGSFLEEGSRGVEDTLGDMLDAMKRTAKAAETTGSNSKKLNTSAATDNQ